MAKKPSANTTLHAVLEPAKVTRREKVVRALFTVAGAVGAAILAVIVNVVSAQINNGFDAAAMPVPVPSPSSTTCVEGVTAYPRTGHQYVEIYVRDDPESCWKPTLDDIDPGDQFQVRVQFVNYTDASVEDVVVHAWMPEEFELVPGTTTIKNSSNPTGKTVSDNIAGVGINVGKYSPGANVFIKFTARMVPTAIKSCEFHSWAIAARLPDAPAPDNDWSTAGVISVGSC